MTDHDTLLDLFKRNGVLTEPLVGPGGTKGFQIQVDSDHLEQPVGGSVGALAAFTFNADGSLNWIGLWS